MQSSKSRYIGTLRTESENRSVEGMMQQAAMKMMNAAWRRLEASCAALTSPMRLSTRITSGISNATPKPASICTSKSISDLSVHIGLAPR